MQIKTSGLGHVALRVTDLARSKRFYADTLGFPIVVDTPAVVLVNLGGVLLGLLADPNRTAAGDRFDPHRVGLDHLALAVAAADLAALRDQLDTAGVPNNGIQRDDVFGVPYISFYDPDGIAWELYAAPTQ